MWIANPLAVALLMVSANNQDAVVPVQPALVPAAIYWPVPSVPATKISAPWIGSALPEGPTCNCGGRRSGPWHDWWIPPCNMIQHLAYDMHGYYYFSPYNVINVPTQQAVAVQWGADPRNPYSNQVFDQVYDAFYAAHPDLIPQRPDTEETPSTPPADATPPTTQPGSEPQNAIPTPSKPGDAGTPAESTPPGRSIVVPDAPVPESPAEAAPKKPESTSKGE